MSWRARAKRGSSPRRLARASVVPSAKAPAAEELPSRPSEPAARTRTPAHPSRTRARTERELEASPSPAERGASAAEPHRRLTAGQEHFARPQHPRRPGEPRSRLVGFAREAPECGARLKAHGPRLRRGGGKPARGSMPTTRTRSPRRRRRVGPDPTRAARSPGTSERTSVTRRAPVARPSRPPLTAESEVRRRLISAIGAPRRAETSDPPALLRKRQAGARQAEQGGRSARDQAQDRVASFRTRRRRRGLAGPRARSTGRARDARTPGLPPFPEAGGHPAARLPGADPARRAAPESIAAAALPDAKTPTRRAPARAARTVGSASARRDGRARDRRPRAPPDTAGVRRLLSVRGSHGSETF